MQLVAYGAQDAFLTGDPDITFFKIVYRRHTNFAMESIRQTFSGNSTWGNRATATISRNGDLIKNCYIEAKLPKLKEGMKYVNSIGHKLIKEVELEIGGQLIDRQYGEWLEIWSELTLPEGKYNGYGDMIGRSYDETIESVYVPLQFFFCRHPGLALPLIAMQYHEVKLSFTFSEINDCIEYKSKVEDRDIGNINVMLWVDYIYLDTDERRRFAQTKHNMLIEQIQYNGGTTMDTIDLTFNHPCKELIWVIQGDKYKTNGFNFSCQSDENKYNLTQGGPLKSAMLKLNGHDRFEERNGAYFKLVQPYQHHTRIPSQYIYSYSFALHPEEQQPSGSCNFSRIDNARLMLKKEDLVKKANPQTKVFAINYNVLRIQSGMAGLAFSN